MAAEQYKEQRSEEPTLLAQSQFRHGIFRVMSLQKTAALLIWLLFIGGYIIYSWRSGLSATEAIVQLGDWLHRSYGPLLYLLLFVLLSLLFFSAGILSVAGGVIFASGADGNLWLAFLYVMAGTLLSALISFGLARYFGATLGENRFVQQRRWRDYLERLQRNGFMAVLLMRLLLLPFDPINYLAGFAKVQWRSFALATLLGIIPTAFAFTSFGAAIDLQALAAGQMPTFDWRMLALAIVILIGSLLGSRYYQRRAIDTAS
ncbi:MAG: TVP38/TMEM64 family protein [Caldilineaceae bacterium]|nr:TVP38/TMEM64 family protein [Caldilineaceae bacterium]